MDRQETKEALKEIFAKGRELVELSGASLEEVGSDVQLPSNAGERTRAYRLADGAVFLYLADLPSPHTTGMQWAVGYELYKQLLKGVTAKGRKRGRRNESADRFFVCAYVEWCMSVKELGTDEACRRAEYLFDKPTYETLIRWYKGDKGEYATERKAGKLLIEMFELLFEAFGDIASDWAYELPKVESLLEKIRLRLPTNPEFPHL